MEKNPLISDCVIVVYDATKDRNENELKYTVNGIRLHGGILHKGNTLIVLGVLHRVVHPFGYQMQACPESFAGAQMRDLEEEVSKKVDLYVSMLLQSAEDCQDERVDIEVKITAGSPLKKVVLQEVMDCNANWVVLDRHLRRDMRFYLKHIPCKLALILDNLSVEVLRPHATNDMDSIEHRLVFFMSKPVPLSATQVTGNKEQSVISCTSCPRLSNYSESSDILKNNLASSLTNRSQENRFSAFDDFGSFFKLEGSGSYTKGEKKYSTFPWIFQNQQTNSGRHISPNAPVLCAGCGMKTELYVSESTRFTYSEIQLATNNFSKENLLGEGGYGLVYKGELKSGQLIAAKVRKEASTQGLSEFLSEISVLNFAQHKNIVMLLGYCCKENLSILVYEFVCNKSLDWHLFDNTENVLEWHQRHAIAIGTAKGLRFLHEECRGSPIIHCDLRPSNILLTHDYVPMLGDFGLAKRKTDDGAVQTKIFGTLGYLAPEYAESGTVSARTDVYPFGIILIQLLSGRKIVDLKREDRQQSLREWAEPLIERLALHELIDPRIKDSYDTYELYHMARTAYLCMQVDPEMRPSMGEVVRLLEGEYEHLHILTDKLMSHFSK